MNGELGVGRASEKRRGAEVGQWDLVHWREQTGQILVCLRVTFEII